MKQYETCKNCGASLDFGEKCDCEKKRYYVDSVVCDYGVFERGGILPKLILNSRRIALQIVSLLEEDERTDCSI